MKEHLSYMSSCTNYDLITSFEGLLRLVVSKGITSSLGEKIHRE